jgi:hypothetical protein
LTYINKPFFFQTSGGSSRKKQGPAKRLTSKQHYTIDFVFTDGEPLEPNSVANIFTTQCGVLIRDMVPISIQEWNKPKAAKGEPASPE